MLRTIAVSRFKARCVALLDEVARTKQPLVVTKHGVPVARVVPFEPSQRRPLRGSISFLTDDEDELFSTGEWWTADE